MLEDVDVQRYVLPALLVVLFLGVFLIVVTNGSGGAGNSPSQSSSPSVSGSSVSKTKTATPAAAGEISYATVKPGDTPTKIAAAAGISVDHLLELNPSIDPRALRPGQTLNVGP